MISTYDIIIVAKNWRRTMFHERLKEKRIQCKKTQKDLAEYLNISPQSVSKWENGESFPSLEYLPKIAEFYKCDINSFFEDNKVSIEDMLTQLRDGLEKLEELEIQEPEEEDEEDYEEWEAEIEEVKEEIENLLEKLKIGESGIADILMGDQQKEGKPKTCSNEKYDEFFKVAKSVLVVNSDEQKLIKFFTDNKDVAENIVYICNLLIRNQSASISMLQRRLDIGYNKAGKIIDGLEEIRVVSPFNHAYARKINYEQILKLKSFIK